MDNKEKLVEWLKDCPVPYHVDTEFMQVVTIGFDLQNTLQERIELINERNKNE